MLPYANLPSLPSSTRTRNASATPSAPPPASSSAPRQGRGPDAQDLLERHPRPLHGHVLDRAELARASERVGLLPNGGQGRIQVDEGIGGSGRRGGFRAAGRLSRVGWLPMQTRYRSSMCASHT
jgi:hypothetical protein